MAKAQDISTRTVGPKSAKKAINFAIKMRRPVFLWGPPGIGKSDIDQVMRRAVARGMKRRTAETIEHIGLDEKSFRVDHQYVTTLNDLDEGRVLEVVETRTTEATVTFAYKPCQRTARESQVSCHRHVEALCHRRK